MQLSHTNKKLSSGRLRLLIVSILPLALCVALSWAFTHWIFHTLTHNHIESRKQQGLLWAEDVTQDFQMEEEGVVEDLNYLSSMLSLQSLYTLSRQLESEAFLQQAEQLTSPALRAFFQAHPKYSSLGLIDSEGQSLLRIDAWGNILSYAIPSRIPTRSQTVKQALKQEPRQYTVSPYYRIETSDLEKRSNTPQMIVREFFMNIKLPELDRHVLLSLEVDESSFITRLSQASPNSSEVMLIESTGFFISHPEFMKTRFHANSTLPHVNQEFPELTREVLLNQKSLSNEQGDVFLITRVQEQLVNAPFPLTLLQRMTKDNLHANIPHTYWGIAGAMLIFSFIVGLINLLIFEGVFARFFRRVSNSIFLTMNQHNSVLRDLSDLAVDLDQGCQEQVHAIKGSSDHMFRISRLIAKMARESEGSQTIARKVAERTEDGIAVMDKMVKSMKSIRMANNHLDQIRNIIREISAKTNIINDIVLKTQFLSFNASIEAERAGQHGRGFAVVAEEVGNLAQLSGKAADEIRTLLDDSQNQVASIVQNTQDRVSEGRVVMDKAATLFTEIARDIEEISEKVKSSSLLSNEQMIGIDRITSVVQDIDESINNNHRMSKRVVRAGTYLIGQQNELNRCMAELTRHGLGEFFSTSTEDKTTEELTNFSESLSKRFPVKAFEPANWERSAESKERYLNKRPATQPRPPVAKNASKLDSSAPDQNQNKPKRRQTTDHKAVQRPQESTGSARMTERLQGAASADQEDRTSSSGSAPSAAKERAAAASDLSDPSETGQENIPPKETPKAS